MFSVHEDLFKLQIEIYSEVYMRRTVYLTQQCNKTINGCGIAPGNLVLSFKHRSFKIAYWS